MITGVLWLLSIRSQKGKKKYIKNKEKEKGDVHQERCAREMVCASTNFHMHNSTSQVCDLLLVFNAVAY